MGKLISELKFNSLALFLQYFLNITFPIEDFPTQLAVWQNTIVAIVLQGAATDFQALQNYLSVSHPPKSGGNSSIKRYYKTE